MALAASAGAGSLLLPRQERGLLPKRARAPLEAQALTAQAAQQAARPGPQQTPLHPHPHPQAAPQQLQLRLPVRPRALRRSALGAAAPPADAPPSRTVRELSRLRPAVECDCPSPEFDCRLNNAASRFARHFRSAARRSSAGALNWRSTLCSRGWLTGVRSCGRAEPADPRVGRQCAGGPPRRRRPRAARGKYGGVACSSRAGQGRAGLGRAWRGVGRRAAQARASLCCGDSRLGCAKAAAGASICNSGARGPGTGQRARSKAKPRGRCRGNATQRHGAVASGQRRRMGRAAQ